MNTTTTVERDRVIIESNTLTVKLIKRSYTESVTVQYSNAKAFVWGTSVPESVMVEPVYTRFGDDPANDSAWRKFNKLEVAAERVALDEALNLLQVLGYEVDGIDPKFSRKAGCSCSCSPGFRLGRRVHVSGLGLVDIYVTVKEVAVGVDTLMDSFAC